MKGQANQLDQGYAQPRIGLVSSVDPTTYTVRVTLQPEGILSGWLPTASSWVGNGWGFACCPNIGDQVIVIAQEGNADHGIVVGRLWSNQATPPDSPAGECWLVHQTGSSIKLHNDGSLESTAATWTHNGSLHVTGDLSDSIGPLSGLRTHYNEHTHPPATILPVPTDP